MTLHEWVEQELKNWNECRICGELVRGKNAHTLCMVNAGEIIFPRNEDGTVTFHIIHGKEKDDMS